MHVVNACIHNNLLNVDICMYVALFALIYFNVFVHSRFKTRLVSGLTHNMWLHSEECESSNHKQVVDKAGRTE